MEENFPTLNKGKVTLTDLTKYVRVSIVKKELDETASGTIWGFIARVDNETKGLGKVRRGDIMKAANYTTPARHARGNLFDSEKGFGSVGVYGPAYLR